MIGNTGVRRRIQTIGALAGVLAASLSSSAVAGPRTAGIGTYITSVRFAHHAGFDRVVWTLHGPLPHHRVNYVRAVTADPSGRVVHLTGRAKLHVVFFSMSTSVTQPQGTWTPLDPEIRQVKGAGNFEGYTSYGVGLAAHRPFHVFTRTSPNRVILDVRHPRR